MTAEEMALALRDLGVETELVDKPNSSAFAPGVWFEDGRVKVCPWAAHPSDVLHECAHWAIIPSRFRQYLRPGEVEGPEFRAAIEAYTTSRECFDAGPDHWLMRAILQLGDCEAQAWSFAAAYRIGYDPKLAFCFRYEGVPEDHQPYGGEGEDVFLSLSTGHHFGINGMQAAGMCTVRDWPNMLRWVQP